ncbi:MAG: hypothetical protein KA505_10310 [Xanthomonadales bacterium]|jgi:hypothetical protein|nr:hypothetical protein [Xanthomonadales bacterium]MBP7622393.1 hypothetical protein [Xanthomonadales bacterium]
MILRLSAATVVMAALSSAAMAGDWVPVRIENSGMPVVVKQFRDGVQCDLRHLGRGNYVIGGDLLHPTRRHLERDFVAGEAVELVFVRNAVRPARTGIPGGSDQFGVRTRLVPESGMAYRVRVEHRAMRLDAIVESRPVNSRGAYERVPTIVSYSTQDLCVTGVRGRYASR